MRKSDKKYAGEYMLKPSASKFSDDNVVYIGKWYYFVSDEKNVKSSSILLFVFSILQMFLLLCSYIFFDALATYIPYVFMPMIFLALPLALNIGCTASLLGVKEKVTHKQYDKKIKAQKKNAYSTIALDAIVLAADIVMYCLNKGKTNIGDIILTISVVIIAVVSALSIKFQKNLDCTCDC